MNRAVGSDYTRRRAMGLCGIAACTEKPSARKKDGKLYAFCDRHRERQRELNARRRRRGLTVNLSLEYAQAEDLDYVCGEFGLTRQDALRLMIVECAKGLRDGRVGRSDLEAGGSGSA